VVVDLDWAVGGSDRAGVVDGTPEEVRGPAADGTKNTTDGSPAFVGGPVVDAFGAEAVGVRPDGELAFVDADGEGLDADERAVDVVVGVTRGGAPPKTC
jgi:hypothetical protein